MDVIFGNPMNFQLLWVAAAAAVVFVVASVARRRALARFATVNLLGTLVGRLARVRRRVEAVCVVAALALMAVALADPRWGRVWRQVPQKGIEVVFLLDVSRSMLAQDAAPSRLERAKQQIRDMTDAMAGDRVGLVAFAGGAQQKVPLTTNYHDFKIALEEIGPHSVRQGGSRLGDAIETAVKAFLTQTPDHKALIIITDGEDQESKPVQAAKAAYGERGVRVFTIGIGDMGQGARIPVSSTASGKTYLQHEGQQVWSKMDGAVLKEVALAGGGAFIPAGMKRVDMAQVYHRYISVVEQTDFETARIKSYQPRYAWFVAAALAVLLVEVVFPLGGWRRRVGGGGVVYARGGRVGQQAAAVVVTLAMAASASAQSPSDLVSQGNNALQAGDPDKAIQSYEQASGLSPGRYEPLYNRAVAHYRKHEYDRARDLFTQALESSDRDTQARAQFNIGNCDYAQALELAQHDRPGAIKKLQNAISHYRGALAVNPQDADARANAELANTLIDRLGREQAQQQKQQQQDGEQGQDRQGQQSEPGQDGQPDTQSDEQREDQQRQGREPGNDEQDKQTPSASSDPSQGGQSGDQPQPDGQDSPSQQQPVGQDAQPQQQAGQDAQAGKGQDASQMVPGGQSEGENDASQVRVMTEQEAQKMLQAIRDRDLQRRLQQRQQSGRGRAPVDRDW